MSARRLTAPPSVTFTRFPSTLVLPTGGVTLEKSRRPVISVNYFIFIFFKVEKRNSLKFWIQKYFSSIWPRGPSWLSVQRTICCLPRGCRRNVFNFNMPFIFKGLQGVLIWTRFFFDTLWVPAGIKAEQFNVIDADAPGGSGLGSAVQFESVTNSSNMPSWYVNFNAWKFRQDWPSGNASRVSFYHFPTC